MSASRSDTMPQELDMRIVDHPTWCVLHMSDTRGYDVVRLVRLVRLVQGPNEGRYEVLPWEIDTAKFKRYHRDPVLLFDIRADAMRWCRMHYLTGA